MVNKEKQIYLCKNRFMQKQIYAKTDLPMQKQFYAKTDLPMPHWKANETCDKTKVQ